MEDTSKGVPQFATAEYAPNTTPTMTAPARTPLSFVKAVGVLVLVGVASPLLDLQDPVHGLIGLVILLVGIRFAWRFTAGRTLAISGPHTPSPAGVI